MKARPDDGRPNLAVEHLDAPSWTRDTPSARLCCGKISCTTSGEGAHYVVALQLPLTSLALA
jgi:hypothetical protein